ncbi:MAG: septation protein SpoVG family protein [Oscillospiraceae bacterium]|nr:septation protein SpoVG family protein [Oscillospiraceae bacterium]
MKITQVNIRRTFDEERLKAIISITIDNCLAIHEIKVIQGEARLFVTYKIEIDNEKIENFTELVEKVFSAVMESGRDMV